jgi:hypothetical protein
VLIVTSLDEGKLRFLFKDPWFPESSRKEGEESGLYLCVETVWFIAYIMVQAELGLRSCSTKN